MKKIVALLLIVASVVGIVHFVKGGSSVAENTPETALCFVVECTDLFPGVDFSKFENEIMSAVQSRGAVSMIVADAKPYLASQLDVPAYEKDFSDYKKAQICKKQTEQIIADLNANAVAKSADNDLLGAVKLAKKELRHYKSATCHKLVVISSGISRAGVLSFQNFIHEDNGKTTNDLLTTPPADIVKQLVNNSNIPDLSDVDDFTWYALGTSSGEQIIPDSAQSNLEQLWEAIGEAADCDINFDDIALSGDAKTEYTSTVIPMTQDTLEIDMATVDTSFSEQDMGFVANKATFVDADAAKTLVQKYAQSMKAQPESTVYLVGMTATLGDADRCKALSLDRANAVKSLFTEMGISGNRITVLGLGYEPNETLRVNDVVDGQLIEALAVQNRKVFLLGSESEKLAALLAELA